MLSCHGNIFAYHNIWLLDPQTHISRIQATHRKVVPTNTQSHSQVRQLLFLVALSSVSSPCVQIVLHRVFKSSGKLLINEINPHKWRENQTILWCKIWNGPY